MKLPIPGNDVRNQYYILSLLVAAFDDDYGLLLSILLVYLVSYRLTALNACFTTECLRTVFSEDFLVIFVDLYR